MNNFIIGSARELTKDGTWFRDSEGRYVLFRGVNFASRSKLPPYLPITSLDKKTINLNELKKDLNKAKPQFEYLKHLGCNIVRLLLMWTAIEPKPNPNLNQLLPEGEQYLQLIKEIIDILYTHDLFVILDFHQDIAHGVYGGDGFPDWALAIDERHRRPPQSDFKDRGWAAAYYLNNLVRYTLRSFWNNKLRNIEAGLQDYPIRTHLEKTIGQTVRFFKNLNNGQGHPAILGVQPFNEPHQVGMDKQAFEKGYLKEFYSNVLTEINKFDSRLFVLIEPRVDWNIYSAIDIFEPRMDWSKYNPFQSDLESQLGFIHKQSQIHTWLPMDSNFLDQFKSHGIFSFHYYDPWTLFYSFFSYPDNMYNKQREWPDIFKQMHHAAISRGLVPFLTEFGGSHDWEKFHTDFPPYTIYHGKQIRAYMNLQFIQVESLLTNAIYWNYDLYNTAEGKDNWNLENFSLLGPNRVPRHTDIVSRPYLMRSSAKPYLLFFDLETKLCAIILKGPVVSEPTIVYVPYDMHYSSGFKVWASSKDATWDRNNQLLYWHPDRNQLSNQIIITSYHGLNTSVLPDASKKLLDKTTITFEFSS